MPSVVGGKWSNQARFLSKSGERVKEPLAGHYLRVSSILLRKKQAWWAIYSGLPSKVCRSCKLAVNLRDQMWTSRVRVRATVSNCRASHIMT